MNKIKIVHVITDLYTGGAEMMLYKLLSNMNRNLFEPYVISLMDQGTLGKRILDLGIPVITVNMKFGRPTLKTAINLIDNIRKIKPDLIQGWMYHGNIAATFAKKFLSKQIPLLWNIRQTIYDINHEKKLTAYLIKLGAKLSNSPDYIIYNSKVSALQHENIGYAGRKKVLLPNGFDTEKFKPSLEAHRAIREELRLPEDTMLVGLIARYHQMKDHDNFLRAISRFTETDNVHFLLVGKGIDHSNNVLVNIINQQKLCKKHIHLLGERSDMSVVTASLDVAVSSSSHGEGFPNVIGEAMSCGVPCVVTDVGDSAWIVGDTGVAVTPRNPEELSDGLKRILTMNSEKRKKLGYMARQRILDEFSMDNIIAQYTDIYLKAIKGSV